MPVSALFVPRVFDASLSRLEYKHLRAIVMRRPRLTLRSQESDLTHAAAVENAPHTRTHSPHVLHTGKTRRPSVAASRSLPAASHSLPAAACCPLAATRACRPPPTSFWLLAARRCPLPAGCPPSAAGTARRFPLVLVPTVRFLPRRCLRCIPPPSLDKRRPAHLCHASVRLASHAHAPDRHFKRRVHKHTLTPRLSPALRAAHHCHAPLATSRLLAPAHPNRTRLPLATHRLPLAAGFHCLPAAWPSARCCYTSRHLLPASGCLVARRTSHIASPRPALRKTYGAPHATHATRRSRTHVMQDPPRAAGCPPLIAQLPLHTLCPRPTVLSPPRAVRRLPATHSRIRLCPCRGCTHCHRRG
ncbi:hypothetical protein GGX14DRAFT_628135 [Mycena pura]|uniref:Uncharacterized protein n=1 Tax=Mycena pura TaxID=153505 RepID=A0AAD6YR68_9AGAR|nr:hypothetical protein GGX14DRAFT_628135 [Mycena pura]